MAISETFQTRLYEIRQALKTIGDIIDDLAEMPSLDSVDDAKALDLVMHRRDEITDFLADLETTLGVYVPHIMNNWDKALTSAIEACDTQIVITLDPTSYLLVPFDDVKGHITLHFGIAKNGKIKINPAPLSKAELYASFLVNGYTVDDDSEWHSTLADAERSWSGAWAAADEWNATHDANWRVAQIQAEAPCCDGTKTTTLCVNRTRAGLYEPGFYEGGNVRVVKYAIPENEIAGWYDSYEHKVDYRHDLAWEIVIPR